ncbi:MAG: FtsQ-type POTRA domain-containing protein [Bacilli bacterium]
MDIKFNNIIIKGNNILTETEILEQANIDSDSSFFKTTSYSIKRNLLKHDLIKKVKVKKKLFNNIEIKIKEKRLLYLDEQSNKVILEDKTKINNNNYQVPILVNYVPNTKYNSFIKQLNKIETNILDEVSEITYKPTELDDGRFLLSMDDGNYVYLTLTKFHYLNYYDDMLPEFNGKKGILYLDSGNTFKIME